jgi:hypothetical protein
LWENAKNQQGKNGNFVILRHLGKQHSKRKKHIVPIAPALYLSLLSSGFKLKRESQQFQPLESFLNLGGL